MNTRRWLVVLLIGMFLLLVRSSWADDAKSAAEALKRGDSLREKGDLDGVLLPTVKQFAYRRANVTEPY